MPIYVYIYFDFNNELFLFCKSLSTKIHLKSFTYISDYMYMLCSVILYYLLVIYIFKYLTL